ncbi:hypothetical protein [Actinoallomurus iriomotensis]|uniref:Uncharacterized protein n=1 Tax=Actinoallomurus iriomotensis TaxID=478107 RepID=A0A9W6RL56_9ACTN|nr:hypothetical protein [Actinoallomurus iriomotensis]GLY77703.1 hypothetical protein Airi01_059700 [Actinoallomurus iriomotensis]
MEPLQMIAFESARRQARQHLLDSRPEAPRVPYRPTARHEATAQVRQTARVHLAGLLRRTADRVDPCATPSAG